LLLARAPLGKEPEPLGPQLVEVAVRGPQLGVVRDRGGGDDGVACAEALVVCKQVDGYVVRLPRGLQKRVGAKPLLVLAASRLIPKSTEKLDPDLPAYGGLVAANQRPDLLPDLGGPFSIEVDPDAGVYEDHCRLRRIVLTWRKECGALWS
jgi:hypothetical protein